MSRCKYFGLRGAPWSGGLPGNRPGNGWLCCPGHRGTLGSGERVLELRLATLRELERSASLRLGWAEGQDEASSIVAG